MANIELMNSRTPPTRLGLLGLLFFLPIGFCYAELTVFVEAPNLDRYRSGALRHDFGGPGPYDLRMQFTFDESYSERYDYIYRVGTEYHARFDVLRAYATGAGASFGSTYGEASLSAWRPWTSSVWQYTLSFGMLADDPIAANARGYARFESFGAPPGPLFDTYSFAEDPYFSALGASFRIVYINVEQSPEEFLQSFLSVGLKDKSQMIDFYADVSMSRYTDGPSITAYQAYYSGFNMEENDFSLLVAVPEPSSYGIAGVGLIAIAALIRRRSRRSA